MKTRSHLRALLGWSVCALALLSCGFFTRVMQESPTPVPPTPLTTFTFVPLPTSTRIAQPTRTAQPANTPTEKTPSCYRWDQITKSMAGRVVCVYGIAYSHQGQSRIDFSPKPNTFFLIDTVYYYPELESGTCVVAEEMVQVYDGKIPYMTINGDLYNCEPWMME